MPEIHLVRKFVQPRSPSCTCVQQDIYIPWTNHFGASVYYSPIGTRIRNRSQTVIHPADSICRPRIYRKNRQMLPSSAENKDHPGIEWERQFATGNKILSDTLCRPVRKSNPRRSSNTPQSSFLSDSRAQPPRSIDQVCTRGSCPLYSRRVSHLGTYQRGKDFARHRDMQCR